MYLTEFDIKLPCYLHENGLNYSLYTFPDTTSKKAIRDNRLRHMMLVYNIYFDFENFYLADKFINPKYLTPHDKHFNSKVYYYQGKGNLDNIYKKIMFLLPKTKKMRLKKYEHFFLVYKVEYSSDNKSGFSIDIGKHTLNTRKSTALPLSSSPNFNNYTLTEKQNLFQFLRQHSVEGFEITWTLVGNS